MSALPRAMRGILSGGLIAAVVLFGAAQLYRPARVNPPVDPSRTLAARVDVPPAVSGVFDRACHDCHSNRTRWPWYSHVAPLMWGVAWDVDEGRRHWNASDWRFSTEEGAEVLDAICAEVERGTMPLPRYLWFHPSARLTDDDVRRLCDWAAQAADELFEALSRVGRGRACDDGRLGEPSLPAFARPAAEAGDS